MKSSRIVKYFILFISLFFLSMGSVKAIDVIIDANGDSSSWTGTTEGLHLENKAALHGCWALKVNLVELTDGGPEWVSFYYLFSDKNNTATSHYNLFINNKWGITNVITTAEGRVGAIGQIYTSQYSNGAFATKIKTLSDLGISEAFFHTSAEAGGLTFDSGKTKSALDNQSDIFFKVLYQLLERNESMQRNSAHLPNLDMSTITSWEVLKNMFKDTTGTYAEQLQVLKDYRIVIEPIYTFKENDHKFYYTTIKSAAYYLKVGKFYGVGNLNSFINNCYISQDHGTIKSASNSEASLDAMQDQNNGYGYLIVSIVNDYTPPPPENVSCPEGTGVNGGTDPYNNYYLFLLKGYNSNHSDDGKTITNGGANEVFKDKEIFQDLINSVYGSDTSHTIQNTINIVDESIVPITSSNVFDFYTHFHNAIREDDFYYKDGPGDYYIWHHYYTNADGVIVQDSHESEPINTLMSKTVFAANVDITANDPDGDGGYNFLVRRVMPDPIAINGTYYSPAEFRISYCIKQEEIEQNCDDNVQQAVCTETETGVDVVFHENYDLKTCTIPHGTESGFTAIEKEETMDYCTIACKEDLNISLPGTKFTAAGQYFVLDKYIPEIAAKRSCVSDHIDYNKFDNDLKEFEKDSNLPFKYNKYKDYLRVYNKIVENQFESTTRTDTCNNVDADGNFTGETTDYEVEVWKIPSTAIGDLNDGSRNFEEVSGEAHEAVSACNLEEQKPTGQEKYNEVEADYRSKTDSAKAEYETTMENYRDTINAYNRCFTWTDIAKDSKLVGGGSRDDTYSIEVFDRTVRPDYAYSFEPEVSFDYFDRDSSVFPTKYTYDYNSDVDMDGFNVENVYWGKGTSVDNEYKNGGSKTTGLNSRGLNFEPRELLNCKAGGNSCNSKPKVSSSFYTSAYLRRNEDVTYTYHLPTIYTRVPDGTVSRNPDGGSKTMLQLEDESVPVNVNTLSGTYDYIITIKKLKDDLRESKFGNNPDDKIEDRFKEKALNAGSDYVCTYDVVNDIYLPDKSRLNFFYRTVDPFEINPVGRELGYNWTDGRGDQVRQNMVEAEEDYQVLTNGGRDKFEFTLTPAIMKQIRKYNSTKASEADSSYADWDLNCSDYDQGGYHCYSNFLSCLTSGGTTGEPGQSSCNSIFENALSNYNNVSNYDLGDLNTNRNILINKQNAIDGRG